MKLKHYVEIAGVDTRRQSPAAFPA